MAPTAKTTAAPAKKAVKKVAPPLDLAALTVTEAPAPTRERTSNGGPNPFLSYIRDSWGKRVQMTPARGDIPATYRGSGKMIERVPEPNVKQVENLLRAAALKVGQEVNVKLGCAVQSDPHKDKGFYNIRFCAQSARQRQSK